MQEVLQTLLDSLHRRESVALVTVIEASGVFAPCLGQHTVLWRDASRAPVGNLGVGEYADLVLNEAREALRTGQHTRSAYGGPDDAFVVFVEVEALPPHLIIVGAGHIAAPLAAMGHLCDFEVTVLDDRPQYANTQRFPTADRVIAGPLREELRRLRGGAATFDENTYLVLVTRGHQYDVDCLLEVLDDPVAYIGMIGSQRRVRAVYELLERDQGIPPQKFDRIHAPIGLDIGAHTPAEIAVCIMAEIINNRRGGPAVSISAQVQRERQARRRREMENGEWKIENGEWVTMILLETIATSVDDCIAAEQGGADRIELNTAIMLGGLTPSLGLLVEARQCTHLPLMVMLRPRAGGFCYSRTEFATLQRDLELALAHGADGVVFGFLHEDGTVDVERTRLAVRQTGDRQTVFHRAFDVTPDPFQALDQLIDAGVTRVLTSGQEANAYNGAANIRRYIDYAAGRIQILPGGGINRFTMADVLQRTGATQIHASLSRTAYDRSTSVRPQITFGGTLAPPEEQYKTADANAIAAMRAALDAHG